MALAKVCRRVQGKAKLLQPVVLGRRFSDDGGLLQEVSSYYGSSSHYDDLWGEHFHIGYFPHLEDSNAKVLEWTPAAQLLTQEMCDMAGIGQGSRVCDFGCGVGTNVIEIAESRGAAVTGMDLTREFIERANKRRKDFPKLNLRFLVGSFTDVPKELKKSEESEKFTHVFAQEATCHVAKDYHLVLQEAFAILKSEGVFVNCDFLVGEMGPNSISQKCFYDRAHFDYLQSPGEHMESITKNGFDVVKYVDMSKHAAYGYRILEQRAAKGGHMSHDGLPLAEHYRNTALCFDQGFLVMGTTVSRKRL